MKAIYLILIFLITESAFAQQSEIYIPTESDITRECIYTLREVFNKIPELQRTLVYSETDNQLVAHVPGGGVIISSDVHGTRFVSVERCSAVNPEYKHKQLIERLLDKINDSAKINPTVHHALRRQLNGRSLSACNSFEGASDLNQTIRQPFVYGEPVYESSGGSID